MTELELIIDLHLQTDRQGPGSKEDTLRALEFVGLSNDLPWAIADNAQWKASRLDRKA